MKKTAQKIFVACMLSAALMHFGSEVVFAAKEKVKKSKPAANPEDKQKISMSEKISKSESPIHISADRMEVHQQEGNILFEGHVVVKQDDVTLTGTRLKVAVARGEKTDSAGLSGKIDYIEVEGGVRVTQRDRIATADTAIFYQKDQKVIMRGHPTFARGQDRVEGTVITIYLQQGRCVVEGGKEVPVQAVLFPGARE